MTTRKQKLSAGAYRLSVASRVLAAVVGGYALTSLIIVAVSLALPWIGVGRDNALWALTTVSFLFYLAIIMAVFHARSAKRAWLGLALGAVPCGLIIVPSFLWGNL